MKAYCETFWTIIALSHNYGRYWGMGVVITAFSKFYVMALDNKIIFLKNKTNMKLNINKNVSDIYLNMIFSIFM